MNPSDYRNMQDTIARLRVCRTDQAQSIARLKIENKSLTDALRECVEALEYCGCHEHDDVHMPDGSTECTFCKTVDKALAHAQNLLNPNDPKP